MNKTENQGFDISSKTVAVIGCGGLGCNVCVHLAGAGAGHIFVCDFDSVTEGNLNRQFVYKPEDTGTKKAASMARFLGAYAPDCDITPIDVKIAKPEDLEFAKGCDVIILAVDNAVARAVTERFCRENSIALVNGGINGFYGSCYLYIPGVTPCLGCAGMLGESKKLTNVSCTAGVIGSLACTLAVKYLLGDTSCAGRLLIYDNNEISALEIKASDGCRCMEE